MIRLDRSGSSVLAVCSHPWCDWRALGNSDLEARNLGVGHEAACHPGDERFRDATRKHCQRRS